MTDEKDFLVNAYKEHADGTKQWTEIASEFHFFFGITLSNNAIRKRCKRAFNSLNKVNEVKPVSKKSNEPTEFTEYHEDGSIEASKIIKDVKKVNGDKNQILKLLGYNPKEWELMYWRICSWEGGVGGSTRNSIRFKITPKKTATLGDYVHAIKKAFSGNIQPLNIKPNYQLKAWNTNKLMEIPPIELHLGKISNVRETGEEYNTKIAKEVFNRIISKIIEKQEKEQCAEALLVIGSDFFNSESDHCTSIHKMPQQNDIESIEMFIEGVKMYTQAILTLKNYFKKLNVMLCAGNHARAMETHLYIALMQRFMDDIQVNFKDDYKLTQVFTFGNNAIFFNHGESNLKRLIGSIASEFREEWGKHIYCELHLGHLHKETVVDDESGIITRRIGSPCGTDSWHYSNRFVGATKKHEIFIWDYFNGLSEHYYIPNCYTELTKKGSN